MTICMILVYNRYGFILVKILLRFGNVRMPSWGIFGIIRGMIVDSLHKVDFLKVKVS